MSENKQLTEAGGRALAAARKKEVAQRLEDMRKDVARAVDAEERVVDFTCACSGEPFHVRFERTGNVGRFRVAAIAKGGQPQAVSGILSRWRKSAEPACASFDTTEFDFTGWACPWCHVSKQNRPFTFAKCGKCHALVCSGKSHAMRDGRDWFACHDGCGAASATTDYRLARVAGEAQKGARRPPAGETLPKLPGNDAPRLAAPRK